MPRARINQPPRELQSNSAKAARNQIGRGRREVRRLVRSRARISLEPCHEGTVITDCDLFFGGVVVKPRGENIQLFDCGGGAEIDIGAMPPRVFRRNGPPSTP